jgi:hypothetical protein
LCNNMYQLQRVNIMKKVSYKEQILFYIYSLYSMTITEHRK